MSPCSQARRECPSELRISSKFGEGTRGQDRGGGARCGKLGPKATVLMRVYCDTDSLLSNPQRHTGDAKSQQEAAAIQKLLEHHQSGDRHKEPAVGWHS